MTAAILLPHILVLPFIRQERFFENGRVKFDQNKDRPRNPDFLLFGPTYTEPRQEFQYLENWLFQLGKLADPKKHVSKPQDGPWRMVTTDGVVIATWSMENPDSIRSVDLEAAGVCEAGKCPYSGIERVQGRVSAKRGFIVYSGTMEDAQQWFVDWLLEGTRVNEKGFVSYSIPTWTNRVEFPGGREDPEILRLEAFYPEDIFLMRVAAVPRPARFRVLKEFTADLVKDVEVPTDATWEVWTDPGYATAYALLWVAHWRKEDGTRQFHIADELYERNKTTYDMVDLCYENPLFKQVQQGIIDIAGKGHRDASESALEIWKKKTRINWNYRYWNEDRLIERIRTCAKGGQFTVSPKCKGLLMEAGLGEPVYEDMGPWKYMVSRDLRVVSEKPKDENNHSAKALGYGLLFHLGQVENVRRPTTINRLNKAKQPTWRDTHARAS